MQRKSNTGKAENIPNPGAIKPLSLVQSAWLSFFVFLPIHHLDRHDVKDVLISFCYCRYPMAIALLFRSVILYYSNMCSVLEGSLPLSFVIFENHFNQWVQIQACLASVFSICVALSIYNSGKQEKISYQLIAGLLISSMKQTLYSSFMSGPNKPCKAKIYVEFWRIGEVEFKTHHWKLMHLVNFTTVVFSGVENIQQTCMRIYAASHSGFHRKTIISAPDKRQLPMLKLMQGQLNNSKKPIKCSNLLRVTRHIVKDEMLEVDSHFVKLLSEFLFNSSRVRSIRSRLIWLRLSYLQHVAAVHIRDVMQLCQSLPVTAWLDVTADCGSALTAVRRREQRVIMRKWLAQKLEKLILSEDDSWHLHCVNFSQIQNSPTRA